MIYLVYVDIALLINQESAEICSSHTRCTANTLFYWFIFIEGLYFKEILYSKNTAYKPLLRFLWRKEEFVELPAQAVPHVAYFAIIINKLYKPPWNV